MVSLSSQDLLVQRFQFDRPEPTTYALLYKYWMFKWMSLQDLDILFLLLPLFYSVADTLKTEMLFDFSSYLSKIDPSQSYTIQKLTGGVVNLTVRAIKKPSRTSDEGRFPGHRTLILKYAPPFVAEVGEKAPFSTFRQVRN